MSASIKAQLERARMKRDLAIAQVQAGRAQRIAAIAAKNKYDVMESHSQRKRRQATIERDGEEKLLKLYDRLRAINLCRDLERNFTSAKSIINQLKVNVVGTGPKLRVHMGKDEAGVDRDEDFERSAADWFNHDWQPQADFRGELHFADLIALGLASVTREGDCLAVFDTAAIEDSGKMLFYEADQVANAEKPDELPNGRGLSWVDGVGLDKYGRAQAYIASAQHGVTAVKSSDALVFPKGDVARLIKSSWRFNQVRGIPALLTAAADLQDLYEMRAKELQTAKMAAGQYAFVKSASRAADLEARRLAEGTDGAGEAGSVYENLGSFTGGFVDYLQGEDDVVFANNDRPSINFGEAYDWMLRSGGASLGLSKTYTTLRTDTSYTAFRGDLLLSWATFYALQKFLERYLCDWAAGNAIRWAVRNELLTAPTVGDMSAIRFSWDWPKMPAVDPLKEAMAFETNLSNLLTDYSEILGPEWHKRFASLSEQARVAKKLELPLRIWEKEKDALRFTTANDLQE